MRAKPRRLNGFCSIQALSTRWARCTTVQRSPTGWTRSGSVGSRSPQLPFPPPGKTTASTSSTPPGTSTSPSRWSVRCGSWTEWSLSSAPLVAFSPSQKPFGVRLTATTCPGSCSSTRWTGPVPTSSRSTSKSRIGSKPMPPRSSYRSEPRAISKESSTLCTTRRLFTPMISAPTSLKVKFLKIWLKRLKSGASS